MKSTKIYHTKTKMLHGTIIELDEPTEFGETFETNVFGIEDWHGSFEVAVKAIQQTLDSEYNGSAAIERANNFMEESAERFACGNY